MIAPPPAPPEREVKDGEQSPLAMCIYLAVLTVSVLSAVYYLFTEALKCS